MPVLIIRGAVFIGGMLATGWTLRQGAEALDQAQDATSGTAKLVYALSIAGGGYAAYQLAKSGGLIK